MLCTLERNIQFPFECLIIYCETNYHQKELREKGGDGVDKVFL